MSDAPQPPPGWHRPDPPSSPPPPPPPPPSPPPTAPGGYPPPPPPAAPPGWAAPAPPPPPPGATLPPPPGTPGYGYGYTPYPQGQVKSLSGIATALSILLGLAGVAALGVAYALANRASVLDDRFASFSDVQDADDLAAGTAGLYALLVIATIVLWLIWQFRHAKNAEVLGKRDGLGAGWAIGGWFIPLANLVLGPLQLAQSAKWSDPEAPAGRGRIPGIVVGWWVL